MNPTVPATGSSWQPRDVDRDYPRLIFAEQLLPSVAPAHPRNKHTRAFARRCPSRRSRRVILQQTTRRREATVGHLLDKKEKPRSAPRGCRLPTLRSCCVPRTEEGSSTAFSLFRPKPQSSDFLFHDDQGGGKRRAGMIAWEKRKSPAASRGAFGGAAIRGWGCYLGCCARANLPNRDRDAKFLSAPSS
jgi:hypothetical protein